jgi:hypothetical protein
VASLLAASCLPGRLVACCCQVAVLLCSGLIVLLFLPVVFFVVPVVPAVPVLIVAGWFGCQASVCLGFVMLSVLLFYQLLLRLLPYGFRVLAIVPVALLLFCLPYCLSSHCTGCC